MKSAIVKMHFVALLWGFAGVLGAVTSLDSSVLVTGRALVALLAVALWHGKREIVQALGLSRAQLVALIATGTLLGIHWIFFFKCIATSGVALALVTYSAGPAMIATAEVALGWAAPRRVIFLGALASWFGVWCIHPIWSIEQLFNPGFIYGVISSIAIVLMALSGKRLLKNKISSLALTLGQLFGALLISLPFAAQYYTDYTLQDALVIICLGVFCSALGQSLFNSALTSVRISTASIIATMETPYGIALAALLISQPLTAATTIGAALVTISAVLVSRPEDALENSESLRCQIPTPA